MEFYSAYRQGFVRVAACTHHTTLADPAANAESVLRIARDCHDDSVALAVFPELTLSGYSIEDILLLFIYLELGAMVGIYFKTNHMPVRFLIYVGITALTRLLVGDIAEHHKLDWGLVVVPVAILLLALSNLVVRFGSARYPSAPSGDRP